MARYGDVVGLRALRGLIAKTGLFLTLLFAASLASAGSVNLAWDAVTSASLAGYKIHYGSAAGSYTATIDVGNRTSYTVPNLTDGATYYFAVSAYDSARGESPYSNDVSVTLAPGAPVAAFSASTTTGVAPLALNFINSSTGNVTSYKWTFGDGTTSTAQSPAHTYSAAGTYTVSLTATGPGGSNTQTRSNYISVSGTATAPVAAFTANKTSGTAPVAVQFTSTSKGTISSHAWKFGDGTTSTAQNPIKTYSVPGTYTVSLTVTGNAGSNTKTMTNYITVTSSSAGCPCSIWSTSALPKVVADSDTNAVELGMKFKADRSGYVTGVRFYKSSANTGTHTGSLWTSSGALLGRVTFAKETASGWQTAYFSTPIAVSANTVYVVSYHTKTGRYSADTGYFATTGIDKAPLHALSNAVTGGNGVYTYGSTPTFPRNTYRATNYWVDVLFK
jgi:PKD repeat protein